MCIILQIIFSNSYLRNISYLILIAKVTNQFLNKLNIIRYTPHHKIYTTSHVYLLFLIFPGITLSETSPRQTQNSPA